MRWILLIGCGFLFLSTVQAQLLRPAKAYSTADSLRGSIGPERAWWNVTFYDISVRPDIAERSIQGTTIIAFTAIHQGQRMQVDLQQPLIVDSITTEITTFRDGMMSIDDRPVDHQRDGNVIWIDLPEKMKKGEATTLRIHYRGKPREAKNAPWDGGWVWTEDANKAPWISVACQGLGASVWFPCKDHQSDEPEDGASLHITVPDGTTAIGNGRLKSTVKNNDGTSTWNWSVTEPINTYNIIPYIGKYAHFTQPYSGVEGPLDIDLWVLEQDLEKAKVHFAQVPPMLECFEKMLGPFPWYADGYKLVQAPYLGMEHQSAIAYGNGFVNGYRGMDLSRSGHGLDWDYIIVHESGHEWFGNSITTADIADMWVQEGFTVYTEVAYVECTKGVEASTEYLIGMRRNIVNDRPVIGPYGVNEEGSGDMYYKGASVVHMVRQIMNDDAAFWQMIRDMNSSFKHSIVTSAQIEAFMKDRTALYLESFFDLYLRTTRVPRLEWRIQKRTLSFRWSGVPSAFNMPVDVLIDGDQIRIEPTTEWQTVDQRVRKKALLEVDPNFYVTSGKVR
ncbi:MAG: M1 family metallopeptidase [Bacteroidota bacterium]|nr:M1 family metallopeptidase [Bacteroidota bacterium]